MIPWCLWEQRWTKICTADSIWHHIRSSPQPWFGCLKVATHVCLFFEWNIYTQLTLLLCRKDKKRKARGQIVYGELMLIRQVVHRYWFLKAESTVSKAVSQYLSTTGARDLFLAKWSGHAKLIITSPILFMCRSGDKFTSRLLESISVSRSHSNWRVEFMKLESVTRKVKFTLKWITRNRWSKKSRAI